MSNHFWSEQQGHTSPNSMRPIHICRAQGGCTDSNDGTVEAITVWCPELIDALRSALAAPQPEPEKRIVWCTETDSACSTCPTLRIPCQAATQAAALNARVTVPREPTQEMIAAGEAVFRSYCFRHVNGAIPTYEAMIAATCGGVG